MNSEERRKRELPQHEFVNSHHCRECDRVSRGQRRTRVSRAARRAVREEADTAASLARLAPLAGVPAWALPLVTALPLETRKQMVLLLAREALKRQNDAVNREWKPGDWS